MSTSRQSDSEGQTRTEALRGLSTLADPARQSLYAAVSESDEPITRDAAAKAAGISRTLAAYHLDLLVDAGLLGTSFARPDGATGPGAGRPAKHYYRIQQEHTVSVPPRDYELLADLLATAYDDDDQGVVHNALMRAAEVEGRRFGAASSGSDGNTGSADSSNGEAERSTAADEGVASEADRAEVAANTADVPAREASASQRELCDLLEERGYEPSIEDNGSIGLRNCPFHRLSRSHTDLVCGLNHALLGGVLEGRGEDAERAELCPREGRCCVVIRPAAD
jgi:predicted ArsR family transcriptional regulator